MNTHARAVLACLTILPAILAASCTRNVTDDSVSGLSVPEVAELVAAQRDDVLVVDVRPLAAYDAAHIRGAVHIDLPEIDDERNLALFDAYDRIVVYDQSDASARATVAAKRLLARGINAVRVLAGGFERWTRAGMPTQSN